MGFPRRPNYRKAQNPDYVQPQYPPEKEEAIMKGLAILRKDIDENRIVYRLRMFLHGASFFDAKDRREREMAVFRVEKNSYYTIMGNHHFKNRELSLKAKGLLPLMLSLPEDWDYTLTGLAVINRDGIDSIREGLKELERAGYVERKRARNQDGQL